MPKVLSPGPPIRRLKTANNIYRQLESYSTYSKEMSGERSQAEMQDFSSHHNRQHDTNDAGTAKGECDATACVLPDGEGGRYQYLLPRSRAQGRTDDFAAPRSAIFFAHV